MKKLGTYLMLFLLLFQTTTMAETFGDTTDGGSDAESYQDRHYVGYAVAPEAGTTNYACIRCDTGGGAGGEIHITVWTNDANNPDSNIFMSGEIVMPGGYGEILDSAAFTHSFASGDTLWIGFWDDDTGNNRWMYNSTGPTGGAKYSNWDNTFAQGDAWPGTTTSYDYLISGYINYSPAGGGAPQIIRVGHPEDWEWAFKK